MSSAPKSSWIEIEAELRRRAVVNDAAFDRAARTPVVHARRHRHAPWWGIAAAAVLCLVVGERFWHPRAVNGIATRNVEFVFVSLAARQVSVAGDFNNWSPTSLPLRRSASSGVWSVMVALPRGRHTYSFVVDSTTWVADPAAPRAPEDEFGTPASVAFVGDESER